MEIDFIALIRDLGFPIAVTAYTLIVLNKTMKENTAMVKENTRVISVLAVKLGQVGEVTINDTK